MSKLCVTTVTSGGFHGYVPLFIYGVKTAYPDVDVLIFFADEVQDCVVSAVADLSLVFGGIRTVCGSLNLCDFPAAYRVAAGLRWFVFSEERASAYLSKYDYVYVTDVDIVMCRETPSLLDQHVRHCKCIGLPYSNLVRAGVPVLTGLHFATREYIEKVAKTASMYESQFRTLCWGVLEDNTGCIHDERLLYQITKDAGIEFPEQYIGNPGTGVEVAKMSPECCDTVWFRPEHGVHIGYAKGNTSDADLQWLFDNVPVFVEHAQKLCTVVTHGDTAGYYACVPLTGQRMIGRYLSLYRGL